MRRHRRAAGGAPAGGSPPAAGEGSHAAEAAAAQEGGGKFLGAGVFRREGLGETLPSRGFPRVKTSVDTDASVQDVDAFAVAYGRASRGYRGTLLTKKRTPLGPYRGPM